MAVIAVDARLASFPRLKRQVRTTQYLSAFQLSVRRLVVSSKATKQSTHKGELVNR